LRQWHDLVSEEVVHPFSFEALKRFESRMAVTNVLLTHEGMRSRILRTSTHESRRKHSPELILIEVHARRRHCYRSSENELEIQGWRP
jgi:hypothetical protein